MVTGFAFLSRLTQIAPPCTRFVYLGAGIRLGLPSHPASRRRSCLRLGVSTTSSSRGLSPPIGRPCRAYSRAHLRRARPTGLADLAKDARDEHGERERAGQRRAVAAGDVGTPAVGGGAAWPASSRAIAHRRGPLPVAPMPRTPPQHTPRRNAPWVMRSASWPGRSSRARCANRQAKGHRHRAGTPRIVRVGPSSVKGTRRSFQTASQKRSSGPALERRSLMGDTGSTTRQTRIR